MTFFAKTDATAKETVSLPLISIQRADAVAASDIFNALNYRILFHFRNLREKMTKAFFIIFIITKHNLF